MPTCPHCGHTFTPTRKATAPTFTCEPHPEGGFINTTPSGCVFRTSFSITDKEWLADERRRRKMTLKYDTAARNASPLGQAQLTRYQQYDALAHDNYLVYVRRKQDEEA